MEGDFVGAGWAFPPRVNGSGGIALVRHERELEEAMRIILLTYPGERPMRPEFGSRLRDFVFRETTPSMYAALAHEVRSALGRWEPRVDVKDVRVIADDSDRSVVYLDIQYETKDTNDRRNLVFPFYTIPVDGSDY
jgi:phage baseplate assembly protein W